MSADAVLDKFATTGGNPQVYLGYYHDTANDTPATKPPLVYLVEFFGEMCLPSLPGPVNGGTEFPVTPKPCNAAIVVDATTGDPIVSIEGL